MSITATVEAGKITLPPDVPWPSGTVVRIEPVEEQPPTLWETLKDFDGMAEDLPDDLAANLDHDAQGTDPPARPAARCIPALTSPSVEAIGVVPFLRPVEVEAVEPALLGTPRIHRLTEALEERSR